MKLIDEFENPWVKKSSRFIYENPWISLKEDQVVTPGGTDGIYGVMHFKNKAIGIIPLDNDLNTWLVGQYRYPLDEYSWEIPMGGGALDVNIEESAKRELKEETGLIAQKWTKIGRIHTSNSVTDEEGFIFLAQGLSQAETEHEDTEQIKVLKIPLKEAIKFVMDDRITDSLTVYGLLKVARLLNI